MAGLGTGINYIGDSGFGIPSTDNTTTTLLSGSTSFTGIGEQNLYPDAMVSCFADVEGTLNLQLSVDGSNWYTFKSVALSAGDTLTETINKGPLYFRVKYDNGASVQTAFRLYTYYGHFPLTGPTTNSQGRLDIVQHSHLDNQWGYFVATGLTASQDFILIDISDTTNYNHGSTSYVHLEFLRVSVDASATADYAVEIGYLDNVDDTDGDFHPIFGIRGNNTVGVIKEIIEPFYPNGPKCHTGGTVGSRVSSNDTAFQTDVNLASTLDPSTVDTPSGNGDLVLRATISAGTVSILTEFSYHTH